LADFIISIVGSSFWQAQGLESENAEFAADARLLEPAPRGLRIVKHAVDRDAAGEDLRGHSPRTRQVGPAHEAVEAIVGVVGDPDGIVVRFVGDDT
jgi:hypothetical protein